MESQYPKHQLKILELKQIEMYYDQLKVLKRINLSLYQSEVRAVVGEHGAGKSTLAKIINGFIKPVSGTISIGSSVLSGLTLQEAAKFGIEMVYQNSLSLNLDFSIAENLDTTGCSPLKLRTPKKAIQKVKEFFEVLGIDLDPSLKVADLNLSTKILVNILKKIYSHPKVLIIDEALEKLTNQDFKKIVEIISTLKNEGMTFMLITHRIDDVYALADCISLIKNGEVLITDEVKNIDKFTLVKMAYTQAVGNQIGDLDKEFYQFLRYNEAILRNLPVNLIIVNNDNLIQMISDYCKDYFGLKQTSYRSNHLHSLITSSENEIDDLIKKAHSIKIEKTYKHVPLTFNSQAIVCNIRTFPVFEGTSLIGSVFVIEDVTENEKLQKHAILSEKLASVGLLAAGVAHEVNNPLEIINNSLTYLKYNIHNKDLREVIDDIWDAMLSITNISSNLHSLSDNKQQVIEDIEINAQIKAILNLVKHNADYKHIKISFETKTTDIIVPLNQTEFKQVLLNLIKNAFEAMPDGGKINIITDIVTEDDKEEAEIQFGDTGKGISDVNPDNIFLPFYSTKKNISKNTGLGLSICYGIIEKHYGTISVENIKPSGCLFRIRFPLAGSSKFVYQ